MEMEADEAGGDAGVVGEGASDGLLDQRLRVGAARVVEPNLQLPACNRRQPQAHHQHHGNYGSCDTTHL